MAHKVIVCHASDGVGQAEALMRDNQIRRLPGLDQNEHLVGIFSLNDAAREAQREASVGKRVEVTEDAVAETLAAVCKPRVSRELAAQRERVEEASGLEGRVSSVEVAVVLQPRGDFAKPKTIEAPAGS